MYQGIRSVTVCMLLGACLATAGGTLTVNASGIQYRVISLSLGGPGFGGFAKRGINSLGQVAGTSETNINGDYRAFFYDGSQLHDLGTLGGAWSRTEAFNDVGQVVGRSVTGSGQEHAFFWSQATGLIDLGTLGGSFSHALDINAAGTVVGFSTTAGDAEAHAFVWTLADGMFDIGTFGGTQSRPVGINDLGQVAGWSTTVDTQPHTFVWTVDTGMVDVSSLGEYSSPIDINESGQVLGSWVDAAEQRHVFVWTPSAGMIDIGSLGGCCSDPIAQNETGLVTGSSSIAGDAPAHAFVWSRSGGLVDLGTLGGPQSFPLAIGPAGHVLGWSSTDVVNQHSFLWDEQNGMIDLDAAGAGFSVDTVNAFGQVVGYRFVGPEGNDQRAFSWTPTDGMINLSDHLVSPPPSIELYEAWMVSDAGAILVESSIGLVLLKPETILSNTPPGQNVIVNPVDPTTGSRPVTLNFDEVSAEGITQVTSSTSAPPIPDGFQLGNSPLLFNVQTTATFQGSIRLCFSWQEGIFQDETNARLLHFENTWVDVTTSVDTASNIVCGNVTSLSPFAIVEATVQFLGFAPPLLEGGQAVIRQTKGGRTIPVKFQLSLLGEPTGTPTASIAVHRVTNTVTGTIDTTDLTEQSDGSSDSGDFRYDPVAKQYVFNLSTKGLPSPATYRIIVTISDGSVHLIDFSLR